MVKIYAFADEASSMIDGQIAAIQRNGLQGLEIRGVDGVTVSDISPEKAKEVKKKLDDAGLTTGSVGSPIGKIPIDGDFRAHLDKLKHTLEIADILQTKNLRMFSFFLPKEEDPALYRNKVMDQLSAMAEVAAPTGINLCHENEKGIYGDNAPRCLEILQSVPQLKCVFDPANFVQCNQDTWEAWELLGDRVYYMHIKDALADGFVVPAGKGIGNVKQIVQAYLAGGGSHFTIEPHLSLFDGLAALEQDGERSQIAYRYPDADTAFDAACNAFKKLI